ncbi:hypothetical protein HNY73_009851 [Argiope bruennichi]|uniref:Uncharacterized protein n=1 Tax=Argiope bruennichi TaxID=94029 RepID=A0A8T0FAP7_ARGBR|nr:hypothetical protein HNY73_009851 [Argiope bruennichi]
MEETVTNVHLEVNELQRHDFSPNQSICKQIKNIAVAAEEIAENPEYVVRRKSIAVQTITNEEIIIPKQDPTIHQSSNLTVVNSEGASSMEIDISSQESAMDIASQESLCIKDSNSEEPNYSDKSSSVSFYEDAILAKAEAVRKREEAILQYEEKLKNREETIAYREKIVAKMEMEIEERQEILKIKEQQIADRETAIKIRELEADGYKVIHVMTKGINNRCWQLSGTQRSIDRLDNEIQSLKTLTKGLKRPDQIKREETYTKELQKQRDSEIEVLEKLDPCIRLNCHVHLNNSLNICNQLERHTERMKYLQDTTESFDMTLQQMVDDKQDHTEQYLDDLNKVNEIRSQIEIIEELNVLTPCPVKHCKLRSTIAENTQMETEQPFQVVEKRHTAKRKNSTDSQ